MYTPIFKQRVDAVAAHFDVLPGHAGRVVRRQRQRQRLGIGDQPLGVHGDGIAVAQQAQVRASAALAETLA